VGERRVYEKTDRERERERCKEKELQNEVRMTIRETGGKIEKELEKTKYGGE
jgi:hypothetical protein